MSQQDAGSSSSQQQEVKIVLLGINPDNKENKKSKCYIDKRDGRTYICTPKADSFKDKDMLDLMAHILHPWPVDLNGPDIHLMTNKHPADQKWKKRLGGHIYNNIRIYHSDKESMTHLARGPYTSMQFVKKILSPRTPGDQVVKETSSGSRTKFISHNHQKAERAGPVQQKSEQHGNPKRWPKWVAWRSSTREAKRPERAGPGQHQHEHKEDTQPDPYKDGRRRSYTHGAENRAVQPRNFTLVLLGESGSGKSASGNTILGRNTFLSKASSKAITLRCEEKLTDFHDNKIKVIDTPDFFDEDLKDASTHVEVCKQVCKGELCLYLLVIQIGRFTEGERGILERLEKQLGKIRDRTIILFTHGDDLETSIHEYLEKTNPHLQRLIRQCGDRYHVFNNRERMNEQQVEGLLGKINKFFPAKATGHSQ